MNLSKEIFYEFVDAINSHDVNRLAELMTVEHVFIDAHGMETKGIEVMKKAWAGYFNIFPDYAIEISEVFENGDTVAAFGFASGTYKNINPEKNYFRIPAALKAVIRKERVSRWQVYADTKIPFEIIGKNS